MTLPLFVVRTVVDLIYTMSVLWAARELFITLLYRFGVGVVFLNWSLNSTHTHIRARDGDDDDDYLQLNQISCTRNIHLNQNTRNIHKHMQQAIWPTTNFTSGQYLSYKWIKFWDFMGDSGFKVQHTILGYHHLFHANLSKSTMLNVQIKFVEKNQ